MVKNMFFHLQKINFAIKDMSGDFFMSCISTFLRPKRFKTRQTSHLKRFDSAFDGTEANGSTNG